MRALPTALQQQVIAHFGCFQLLPWQQGVMMSLPEPWSFDDIIMGPDYNLLKVISELSKSK